MTEEKMLSRTQESVGHIIFSGLLKIIYPTLSCIRDNILSSIMIFPVS